MSTFDSAQLRQQPLLLKSAVFTSNNCIIANLSIPRDFDDPQKASYQKFQSVYSKRESQYTYMATTATPDCLYSQHTNDGKIFSIKQVDDKIVIDCLDSDSGRLHSLSLESGYEIVTEAALASHGYNRGLFVLTCYKKLLKNQRSANDWGELLDGVEETEIFVWNLQDKKTTMIKAPEGFDAGQAIAIDAHQVVFTGYATKPRRLGLVYCYNRPSRLFIATPSTGSIKALTLIQESVRTPIPSLDGREIAFLANTAFGPHAKPSNIYIYNLETMECSKVLESVCCDGITPQSWSRQLGLHLTRISGCTRMDTVEVFSGRNYCNSTFLDYSNGKLLLKHSTHAIPWQIRVVGEDGTEEIVAKAPFDWPVEVIEFPRESLVLKPRYAETFRNPLILYLHGTPLYDFM